MRLDKADRRLWRTILESLRPFPLTAQTKLLVGVSGGADSLALLHLLRRQLGADRLVAAHLNHGLRSEAAEEAAFVAHTAVSWQIPLISQEIQVADLAKEWRLSLEAAGRQARYQFLAEQAIKIGATAVAVAHHANDQAETILLHLLRGSGSAGLRGMLPVSQLPGAEQLTLIRPFLQLTRAEIEAYCLRHNLEPRHDPSNEDMTFARNRIRHELLPLLQTYNPQIVARLQQLAIITADEVAVQQAQLDKIWPGLVTGQGVGWLTIDRQSFAASPTAWQRLVLRRVVQQLSPQIAEVGFQAVELARLIILENQSGTEVALPGGILVQIAAHVVTFGDAAQRYPAAEPQLDWEQPVRLPVPGKVDLANGWRVVAAPGADLSLAEIWQNENPWQAFVALAEDDVLWLRPSAAAERFQPLGMAGHSQAIQDLLSNRKVSRGKRPLWPVVATTQHPVWIAGQHLDDRARVQPDSSTIIQLRCFQTAVTKD